VLTPSPITVTSGQPYDIIIRGIGIDSTLNDSDMQLLGPLFLRPGSTRMMGAPLNFNDVNYAQMRITVDIPAVSTQSYGTLIVTNKGSFAAYTAGIVILPPQ
jgi:hypothetical protein